MLLFGAITERRYIEARLREREEVLRLFVDRAPAAIVMFDTKMRYLAVSRRFITDHFPGAEMLPAELVGRSHYELFPDCPERWREVHRRVLAGETMSAEDDPFPRPDGHTDWVRWETTPWHKVDGAIGGVLMFAEVVTARKQAAAARRESEERLRVAIEAADLGVWELDLKTDTAPKRSLRHDQMFGYADLQPEWGQAICERHVLDEDKPRFREDFARALETGVLTFEVRVRWPDGSVHWISPLGQTYYDEHGEPIRLAGVVADITARKRAEETLRESERRARAQLDELETLYRTAPIGLALYDRDLNFVRVNSALADINGASIEEHLGRYVWDVVPHLREAVDPHFRKVLETGEPVAFEVSGETPKAPACSATGSRIITRSRSSERFGGRRRSDRPGDHRS